MEINNLEKIKNYLKFTDDNDAFYFLQILGRKKENLELGGGNKVYKTYFIKSIKHLEDIFEEAKLLCNFHNARAYLNLNPKSFKLMTMHSFTEISAMVLNDSYKKIVSLPATLGDKLKAKNGNKRWIVDIDYISYDDAIKNHTMDNILSEISNCQNDDNTILGIIPTVNGFHIITKPFNTKQFEPYSRTHNIDIHKNNPTLLYFNKIENED